MKLRIKGDSLRYRLTQSDLKAFSKTGSIEESIHFGARKLTYRLLSTDKTGLSVAFVGDAITVHFPHAWIQEWVRTDRVGFDNAPAGQKPDIYLLIEKDFTCLDEVDEDQSDQFPHPLKQSL